MIEFLSLAVFQNIVEEAGGAWDRAPDEEKSAQCEGELLDLIKVVVESSFERTIGAGTGRFSQDQIKGFMREAARDAWREWESYE